MEKPNKNKGKPKFKGRPQEGASPRPFTRQGLVKGPQKFDTKASSRYQARPSNSRSGSVTKERPERPERSGGRHSFRKDDEVPRLLRVHRGDVIAKKAVEKTSWGKEASWYSEYLEGDDTYHSKVILPNLLRIVSGGKGMNILEIGCGEGFFAREFAKTGGTVSASDISPELIAIAKEKGGGPEYKVASGDNLSWIKPHSQDVVVAVLTLQNMEKIEPVFTAIASVLKKGGRCIIVLNHPAFRIPKATAWGFDDEHKVQYRRVEAYLSARREKMDMHPGKKGNTSFTYSFHRSLQDYMKALRTGGFAITRLEEWVSHKTSEKGPRSNAENDARREFPLFMMIEARVV